MIRQFSILVLLLLATLSSHADELDRVSGAYVYETYSFTWPSGQSIGFKELGAKDATLEIIDGKTIKMTMHMLDGSDHVSHAEILEIHLTKDAGYWIAQWPEMAYPVRKDFKLSGDTFSYIIHFDDPGDVHRYGGTDQGVLRRLPDTQRRAP